MQTTIKSFKVKSTRQRHENLIVIKKENKLDDKCTSLC